MNREEVLNHISLVKEIASAIPGLITERETVFLSIVPLIKAEGEILEIGSYTGKSTVTLAKSAHFAGMKSIFACDPFLLESPTDPDVFRKETVEDLFYNTLKKHQVDDIVVFNKMKSEELAKKWNSPIKVLWIDGDHTYDSVKKDFDNFIGHCVPGSIVCLHDVLHAFDGPIRVFSEDILLSDRFGECGLVGSLGWAEFTGDKPVSKEHINAKLNLYRKLTRLVPLIIKMNNQIKVSKLRYNYLRTRIPHGKCNPMEWLSSRTELLS